MKMLIVASSLALSSVAFAADPAPAPAHTTTTTTPSASLHATGAVKAVDLAGKKLTLTVGDKDVTFALGSLSLGADIKAGANVDVDYRASNGVNTASSVALHK